MQSTPQRSGFRVGLVWAGLVGLLALVLVAATVPPWLGPEARWTVYGLFAPVCHQIPARSFQVDGIPLALCHRCFAIYGGVFLSAVGFWWLCRWDGWIWKTSRWIMLGVLFVVGLDWLLDVLGLWENSALSRSLTGLAFGLGAGYFLMRGVLELAGWSGRGSIPAEG